MEPYQEKLLNDQVQALLAEVFDVSPADIHAGLAFGDLPEWDSLGHMELMMRLEEQFGVEITTEMIAQLIDVPSICAYLSPAHSGE
jgi:acyl carrier protein